MLEHRPQIGAVPPAEGYAVPPLEPLWPHFAGVTAVTHRFAGVWTADTLSMRNFSLVGLLCVVAIVGWMAKGMLSPAVSHDPNDRTTIEYWVVHTNDRTAMLAWCQQHPQSQDSGECQLATAAQMRIDAGGNSGSAPAQGSQTNQTGTNQTTGQANDELQAQQDANSMGQ